jgi:hypothetical protein
MTVRVPDAKVVTISHKCVVCSTDAEVMLTTPWLELHEKDGYVFSHSPKWKGVAVAILAYRKTYDGFGDPYEFLAVWESRPSHGGGEYLSSLTGAFDNSDKFTMAQCALNELEEEGGYKTTLQPEYLGWVNGSKSSDGIDHLYCIDLTNDFEEVECRGDGSKLEESTRPEWITSEQIINSKDMILITMYAKWLNRDSLK